MINLDETHPEKTQSRIGNTGRILTEIDEVRFERLWAAKGVPASLFKASRDPFDYALGLKSGLVIYFGEAHLTEIDEFAGWVHLSEIKNHWSSSSIDNFDGMNFDRGIDVRVDDIIWCADAPYGS